MAWSPVNVFITLLQKTDGQTFVWIWDEDRKAETLKEVGKFAADPDIPFSWYDAAVISQKIRNQPCN
jgi:hypothetical protein